MAFGTPTEIGGGINKTAASSIGVNTTVAAAAGDLVWVVVGKDNTGTQATNADNNEIQSITDSVGGNTWSQAIELDYTSLGAAGATSYALFYSVLTNALPSGTTITANLSASTTCKTISIAKCTISAGSTVSVVGTKAVIAAQAGLFSSSTWSPAGNTGLVISSAGSLLVVACSAYESNADLYPTSLTVTDTGAGSVTLTKFTSQFTTGGGSTANAGIIHAAGVGTFTGTKLFMTTGTNSTGSDHIDSMVAFEEITSGGPTQTPRSYATILE